MTALIKGLRQADLEVETVQSYVLNSTHHPIEILSSVSGVPVEASFEASLATGEPVSRFSYSVNHGRRFSQGETRVKKYIPPERVLRQIIREVYLELDLHKAEAEAQQRQAQALEALDTLGVELGLEAAKGQLRRGSLLVQALPTTPTRVTVTITVSHSQAEEIVRKYGSV